MKAASVIAAACLLTSAVGCSRGARQAAAPDSPRGPSLSVVGSGDCVDRAEVTRAINAVFTRLGVRHPALRITVTATAAPESTSASLTVVRDGKIGLARQYSFVPADCDSVAPLLAVTVQRFLTAFPAWAGPSRVVKIDRPMRAQWQLVTAANVEGFLRGASGELETSLDFGTGAHRFGISALWRAATPLALGSNRFYYMTGTAGVLWRYHGSWHPRAELRVGRTRVRGLGFVQNTSTWLPALEAAFAVERKIGPVRVGLQLSASPLLQRAITIDRRFRRRIPWIRLGAVLVVPLWSR